MEALTTVIQRESPATLVREAVWRTQKRWKQLRLLAALEHAGCPVEYQVPGYYRTRLEKITEASRRLVLEFSNLICDGRFSWFGCGPVPLGIPPRWNFDFVAGREWPLIPTRSIKLTGNDGSDIKVPWELSRLQFLPVLGKAWLLTGDTRYRNMAKNLARHWIEYNPVGVGINWAIAMEAALRGMSLCFLLELLSPFPPQEQDWLQTVAKSLWEHLLFIEAHNEFSHFARSNHYLSNIVGLLHLSASLAGPGMTTRREQYFKLVEREIFCQVRNDGVDHEASTGYHFFATQMFTSAFLLMRTATPVVSTAFCQRLQQMYRFLGCLADARGRIPQVGDCDDGRVELLSDDLEQLMQFQPAARHSLTVSSWLGLSQIILNKECGGRTDDAGWYGFDPSPALPPSAGSRPPVTEIFHSSGVAAARRRNAELFFFAMPNGISGKGSHTHNDKLSVILRVGGHEVLSDPGTFCYSRNPALRNSFRATSAHNTVSISGKEQNRIPNRKDQLFRLTDDAKVTPIEWEESESVTYLSAQHDGYKRFGVIHKRSIYFGDTEATIEDSILGIERHPIEASWHLSPTWSVHALRAHGREVDCLIKGPCAAKMKFMSSTELRLDCTSGTVSTAYGAAVDAWTIRVSAVVTLPWKLHTHISWGNC